MGKHQNKADGSITQEARSVVVDVLNLPHDRVQIEAVAGGYSRNRRSLVGYEDKWVFVKEVDTELLPDDGAEELWWLKKDHLCAEELRRTVPELVPNWSRLESDGHILIMTSYRPIDGWEWSLPEGHELRSRYIQAVIDATRRLEGLQFNEATIEKLKLQPYFRDELALDDGFALIVQNEAIRDQLKDKYTAFIAHKPGEFKSQHEQMLELLSSKEALEALAHKASQLIEQPNDSFGHCDVRSDNLAFHSKTGEVKFVDWNWASYATKGFGATEFLIDMARRGADVTPWVGDLNIEMLAATVGFYAKRCLKDPLAPGSTLRDMQAESAAVAFDLYRTALNQSRNTGLV